MRLVNRTILALLALALCCGTALAADPAYPPLTSRKDPILQHSLQRSLKRMGLDGAVQNKRLSVALVDITDPHQPQLAMVNGDHMMYAASLPKIAILFGAFKRIERGEMALNDETRELLTRMIRYSSNSAATAMFHRVGGPYLAELLQSPQYRLYDRDRNGGLWVGKEYGSGSAWKRDPLHNLSHGATAFQVARFYYLLETGRLVSPALTREMKAMLGQPGINHKFVKGLRASHPEAQIFRKSGSWRHWHADSAIVERDGRRYIAVALAEDPQGGQWLEQLIVGLDNLVFQSPTRVASLDQPVQAGRQALVR